MIDISITFSTFTKSRFSIIQFIVNKLKDFFKLQPIEKAWVFGSYSRGEETHESDIERKVLHKDIDLVEEGQLKDFAKDSAERDKILIYERKA